MSVELEYVFRSRPHGDITATVARAGSRWKICGLPLSDADELESKDARELIEVLTAAADKCEELNREVKP